MIMQYINPRSNQASQNVYNSNMWSITGSTQPVLLTNGQTSPSLALVAGIWSRFRFLFTARTEVTLLLSLPLLDVPVNLLLLDRHCNIEYKDRLCVLHNGITSQRRNLFKHCKKYFKCTCQVWTLSDRSFLRLLEQSPRHTFHQEIGKF
jgi:hypothetical protein